MSVSKVLPAVLYHYTTQPGLLGILASDALWATKIHYLNDSAEYRLAFKIANDFLKRLLNDERDSKKRTKIETLLKNLVAITQINVCVCSFSTNRDLLSQWRAYAQGVAGYSIGFHTSELQKQCDKQGFFLAPCIYDLSTHHEFIEQLVSTSLEQDFNTVDTEAHPTKPNTLVVRSTGGNFATEFMQLASVLKGDAFHEECEWRLVSSRGISAEKMSFRPGQSMLTPYVHFNLGDMKDTYLQSVTVGPTVHNWLAEESTRNLLAHWNTAQNVHVCSSTATYRTW